MASTLLPQEQMIERVRGEFHAAPASKMVQVRDWSENVWVENADSMVLLDRTGELKEHLSQLEGLGPDRTSAGQLSNLFDRYLNWMTFGISVLRRGERARALELLWFIQRHLLWMARIAEEATKHYPTPSKSLEKEVSPESYARYVHCTAGLQMESLKEAYLSAWDWAKELTAALAKLHDVPMRLSLIDRIDRRLGVWFHHNGKDMIQGRKA